MSNPVEKWFDNKRLSPLREFSQMQDSFDRLMSDFMGMKKTNALENYGFSPSCEIAEEGNNLVMKFDLPGVTKDQVRVETNQDQLTIHAERKEEHTTDTKKKYLSEVYYGSYDRTFTLPGPVDEKKIAAKFENGVLTITVPKTEALKAKQIPVQ